MTATLHRLSDAEATARVRKARRLAAVLTAHGATADQARSLPPLGRAICAELAGTRPASDATWATVVGLLRVGVAG